MKQTDFNMTMSMLGKIKSNKKTLQTMPKQKNEKMLMNYKEIKKHSETTFVNN
jgi:hypothetical protein